MDKAKALKLAKEYKTLVSKFLPVKSIYLYGSYSKGTFTEDSDIDIAVILPSDRNNWLEDAPLLWKLGMKINLKIEPVLINEGDPCPLYEDILTTGVQI
ncbi:MAG: nucleotidyltransferase domain-containing protein [Muribaculaceae bacterium]|nr:nucleotidyltransferase domain-containing protein [Muribaculaceae bacterium]